MLQVSFVGDLKQRWAGSSSTFHLMKAAEEKLCKKRLLGAHPQPVSSPSESLWERAKQQKFLGWKQRVELWKVRPRDVTVTVLSFTNNTHKRLTMWSFKRQRVPCRSHCPYKCCWIWLPAPRAQWPWNQSLVEVEIVGLEITNSCLKDK